MKIRSVLFPLCLLFLNLSNVAMSANDINGAEIKKQIKQFTTLKDLDFDILVSDNRTFFPCSTPLRFSPKFEADWATINVNCEGENWTSTLRTNYKKNTFFENGENQTNSAPKAVIFSKNLVRGEIITREHVRYSLLPNASSAGHFFEIDEILGRKAKVNLSSGTFVKPRHLEISLDVEKGDNLLLVAENTHIQIITSAIALESGQRGDMIRVKNDRSGKVFKVIVIGEKKVSPLTNM